MATPFEDFPKSDDWFIGEKALKWRERHEAEILEAIRARNLIKKFPSPPEGFSKIPIHSLPPELARWLGRLEAWMMEAFYEY